MFLGVCSNYLCDLKPGDEVAITGPNGQRFVLPLDREKHDYLFLATGTGIAPFRRMMMELLQSPGGPCRSRIDLVMGTAYTSDLLYHDFFLALAAEHENFYYHTAISRESGNANGAGFYIDGVIDRDFAHFAPTLATERTLMYVCGIEGMRYGVVRMLARHELGAVIFGSAMRLQRAIRLNGLILKYAGTLRPGRAAFLKSIKIDKRRFL